MQETPSLESVLANVVKKIDEINERIEQLGQDNKSMLQRIHQSQATYMGDDTALTYDMRGRKIYVDTSSFDISSHIVCGGFWEHGSQLLFEKLIMPGDTVLDVGANIGIYTLAACSRVGADGRVIAFEPNPRLYKLLFQSVSVNGFGERTTLYPLALSNQAGEAEMTITAVQSGGGTLGNTPGPDDWRAESTFKQPCKMARADELLDPGLEVNVMKMDVEGYEGCVIKGMTELLTRSRSIRILMEWFPRLLDASPVSTAETVELLESLGFRVWTINADGTLVEQPWAALLHTEVEIQNIIVSRGG